MVNNRYTFDALMKESGIVIPLIQRDYAQGRKAAFGVRKGFIESIRKALAVGDTLALDFVYGPLDKGVFLPLDGQQRLTTLFLVHWYLGADMKGWGPFEYKSRRCADRFVSFLRSESCVGYTHTNCSSREVPSSWIRRQSAFVPAWEKDSTVSGMMTMLDELYHSFIDYDRDVAVSNLSKIVFYRHLCDASVRPDDTYLKINARGEPLTSWENIKAILDARANKLWRRDDEIGKAARAWRKNINGNWVATVEELIPDRGNATLPHYIAMSVSLTNAAFRNVVDLAAMSCMTGGARLERKAKEKYGEMFSSMSYAEAVVGIRDRAGEVKDLRGVERFFISEFHDHVATYEDYRNEDVFTNEAFIVVSAIFNALSAGKLCAYMGGWTIDRCKNILWGNEVLTDEYLKFFVFSGASFSADVLIESERDGFENWVKNDDRIASVAQTSGFTYQNGIRALLLSEWDDSAKSRFAVSRALNILDNLPEEVNASNFAKWAIGLRSLVASLRDADSFEECRSALCNLSNGGQELFQNIISSEIDKCRIYFSQPQKEGEFYKLSFGVVERTLGLMAGSVRFAYNPQKDDFDEEMAVYFLKECVDGDRALQNRGFRRILSYFQGRNLNVSLPNVISRTDKWFGDWGRVLKQKPMIEAYANMFKCECCGMKRPESPSWLSCYLKFADHEGWPYIWLASHDMPHGGGNRIFAYNTGSRMSKYCACVQYSQEERLLIDAFQKSGCYCIRYGDDYVFSSEKPQFAIKVESVFKVTTGGLEIFKKDNTGRIGNVPIGTIRYDGNDGLVSAIELFLSQND